MFIVEYVEDGEAKQSKAFEDREEAFAFQAGLVARRRRKEDGSWNIEPKGVWNASRIR